MADKQVKIKITAAVVIDGEIVTAGKQVDVAESVAKNLMQRERAELATGGKNKLSVDDLKAKAKDLGIDGYANMKKAALAAAIEAAESE
jgi:hypothetical protein